MKKLLQNFIFLLFWEMTAKGFVRGYLLAYNVASLMAWSYLFFLLLAKLTQGLKWQTIVSPYVFYRLHYFKAFTVLREPLAFVQSAAILEILHSALGLVRSPVLTTTAQVFSRLFLGVFVTYYLGPFALAIQQSPFFSSMLLAWSLAEMIRYGYYADTLASEGSSEPSPYVLIWLRYSAFLVLYPMGVLSELVLAYKAIPVAGIQVGPWMPWVIYGIMALYVPGFVILFGHMLKQRKKYLGSGLRVDTTAEKSTPKSSGRGRSATRKESAESTATPSRTSPRRRKKDEE